MDKGSHNLETITPILASVQMGVQYLCSLEIILKKEEMDFISRKINDI